MKITLTSGILEGSARDILADIRKEDREWEFYQIQNLKF
jgi:hypothetical protein